MEIPQMQKDIMLGRAEKFAFDKMQKDGFQGTYENVFEERTIEYYEALTRIYKKVFKKRTLEEVAKEQREKKALKLEL